MLDDVNVSENELRPVVPPAYGRETALAVLNIIKLHPELHDQSEWEAYRDANDRTVYSAREACSTTRCIAGWAQWIHEGRVVDTVCSDPNDVVNAATRYLDLQDNDADLLFHSGDARAIAALEQLAAGEQIDWESIYRTEMQE